MSKKKCPICIKRQLAILENIVAIDKILFKESTPAKILNRIEYDLYKKTKAAMLLNLYEIYAILGHISYNKYESLKEMTKASYKKGEEIFNESVKLLKTKEFKNIINESINSSLKENKQSNIDNIKKTVISNILFEAALNSLMLEEAILSSKVDILSTEKGKILIDAHKSFVNDLINIATK